MESENVSIEQLESLIGMERNSDQIKEFLEINNQFQIKKLGKFEYISYRHVGFSLCFEENKLLTIFLYNKNYQGFLMFKSKLPLNLEWNTNNTNIVEFLGDTKKKGGGNVPVWLAYDHLGLEFNFLNQSWNDQKNPLMSIGMYKKNSTCQNCSVCLTDLTNSNALKHDCDLIFYCSEKCKGVHLPFHLKYCK